MARLYHGNISSFNGNTYRVELWNGTTAASPDASVEIVLRSCTIEQQGQGDKVWENPIRSTRATVGFSTHLASNGQASATVQTNLQAIAADIEQKWAVLIYKGSNLIFVGRVLADQMRWNRSSEHGDVLEVVAVDALELIKNYSVESSWFSSGLIQITSLISRILKTTGLVDYWTTAGTQNTFIQDSVTYTASNQSGTTRNLGYHYLKLIAFVKNYDPFDTDAKIEYMDCYTALENVLKIYNARITLDAPTSTAAYWVTQANALNGTTLTFDTYDYNGTSASTGNTLSHRVTIGTTARPLWEAKPVKSLQPPVRKVEISYTKKNGALDARSTATTGYIDVTHDDIVAAGEKIKVTFDLSWNATGAAATTRYKYIIKWKVFARNPSDNHVYLYSNAKDTWDDFGAGYSPGVTNLNIDLVDWGKGVGEKIFTQEYPAPPSGCTELRAMAYVTEVTEKLSKSGGPRTPSYTWGTASSTDISFAGFIRIEQSYSDDLWEYDGKAVAEFTTSNRDKNSTVAQIESAFYTGRKNDVGAVYVYTGSTYVPGTTWTSTYNSALTGNIEQITADSIAGIYQDFVPVINGNWVDAGNYSFVKTLYFDSGIWIFNGGIFDLNSEQWDGEWIQIAPVYLLITNTGEGLRIVKDKLGKVYDRVINVEGEVSRVASKLSDVGSAVITDVLNNGSNVPTSQPTTDTTWIPAIKYTDSTEEINWQIKQYAVDEWEKIFATSDQTVNNSDTLTDDSTLQFSMDANRIYHIRGTIIYDTDGVADFKCKWTGPANPTEVTTVIVDGLGNHTIFNSYDTLTNDVSSSARYAITFSAVVKNGANAGTFKFQFAQNTANASDTKRKAGSVFEYMSQPIAGATTVAMDYLTYAHTLYDIAIRQAYTRTMDVNTYTLTLQDINIAYGRTVVMANNSYVLTLQDVTIRKDLVLDTWTGAAGAWAFTKLRTAYAGNCIKVRRASDSATQDIGFSGNDLDTAAIGTFCSGTTGYIHTIYDQSGNGNNLVMTTAASQPLIYSGGAVRTVGGLPSCQFDGSDDYMALTSSIGADAPWTSCMVTKRAASAGLGLALSGTSSQYTAWRYSDNTLYIRGDSGFAASSSTYTTAAQEHLMAVYTSSAASVWSNGSSIAMGSLSLPVSGSFVDLGRRSGSSEYHAADFQLLILWKSDLSAVQSSIDTRIRNYFGL